MLAPIIEKVAKDSDVALVKVNVDESQAVASEHQVAYNPKTPSSSV